MGEAPKEISFRVAQSIGEPDGLSLNLRQYDVFIEATTQMLATPKLHDRLLLALEAIVNGFGHQQAAIATVIERDAKLSMRATVGFEDGPLAARLEMPLDSSAACVRVIHDAHPLWILLSEDDSSKSLFDKMNWHQDVLALPLFGPPEVSPKTRRDTATSALVADHYWTFDSGSRLGVLYVGANRDSVDPISFDRLKRFADLVGVILSAAIQQERLEQLNRDLEQRIEERTAQLVKANEELADANRAKDVFLATLSHELRTPLTPVVGWIKLLRSGTLDAKSVTQALDAIERNAWLQSRLIDDLLDTSRIATGKLHFEPRPTDLNASVGAALDTVRATAASRRIELSVNLHPLPVVVLGEPVRLQQIAWNLISNAIKFTEPGGVVTVTTDISDGDVRLVVEDTGIGIATDFLSHVFDRFRQADGSTSRMHGGLGLGLAIAHALTKMHSGELSAASEGVGCGARFILTIAAVTESTLQPEPPVKKVHPLNGIDVLIVEDSEDALALLSALFKQQGANVISAASAEEALSTVATKRPQFIISDIGMPDTDGYEFLRQVKAIPGMAEIPAIAISGYASEEDRLRAINVGYVELVPKPINVDELFSLIEQLKPPPVSVES